VTCEEENDPDSSANEAWEIRVFRHPSQLRGYSRREHVATGRLCATFFSFIKHPKESGGGRFETGIEPSMVAASLLRACPPSMLIFHPDEKYGIPPGLREIATTRPKHWISPKQHSSHRKCNRRELRIPPSFLRDTPPLTCPPPKRARGQVRRADSLDHWINGSDSEPADNQPRDGLLLARARVCLE
jgi:hypothetical protein